MKRIYMLLKASTNEALEPSVLSVSTDLERIKVQFYANIAPLDCDKWNKQCISKDIHEEADWYEALVLTNHKGWGAPYVVKYEIVQKTIS